MDDIYKNIEEYNPKKNAKHWFIWWYDCWYPEQQKKLNPLVIELLISGKKLNISLGFITVLFCCTERCYSKFFKLYENSKNMRPSTNCH